MDKAWRQVYLLNLKYKNGEEVSDSIGLLISILVRYPEVGSTNIDPETRNLTLTYTISKTLDNDTFCIFEDKLLACIDAFHFLQNSSPLLVQVNQSSYDKLTMLEVKRDVETITLNEINLITSIMQESFSNYLLADDNDSFMEEDLELQEEMIGHMLENIKGANLGKKLIAFREEGRVLVFNK
jgi:hypothetical protein